MIGEHVVYFYLKHVETNPKPALFDGTRSKFSAEIWRFGFFFGFFTLTLESSGQVFADFGE
jgi:hypothetical protein